MSQSRIYKRTHTHTLTVQHVRCTHDARHMPVCVCEENLRMSTHTHVVRSTEECEANTIIYQPASSTALYLNGRPHIAVSVSPPLRSPPISRPHAARSEYDTGDHQKPERSTATEYSACGTRCTRPLVHCLCVCYCVPVALRLV